MQHIFPIYLIFITPILVTKCNLFYNNKGDLNKSIILLEELLLNNPNWSYLWRLLSKASGKLNKKGIAYIALAEEALIKKKLY